jgi:hypothetical protein
VFFVLGLFALRGAYWWAIVAPPLLVDALPRSTEADLPTGDRVANRGMVAVIGLLIAATLPWWRVTGSTPEAALLTRAPLGLTRTVERLVPGGARLFINQPLGSWFELALPRDRVFVDSRIELYPESVWREYADVVSGRSDWDRVLTAWGVDAIVVERSDEQNLLRFIRTSPDWTLAYRDADGLVYVHARRTPDTATPAGIIPAGVAARSLSRMA